MTTPASTNTLKINFVSDVACPWCAIGLSSLDQAIANVKGSINVDLHFEPFQLNPDMPPEGQDITEHITQKYNITAQQAQKNYDNIRARGAELGFEFNKDGRGRTWNTFDCHRLLHWAGELDAAAGATSQIQYAMKKAMLKAYFTDGNNPAAHDVLLGIVVQLGLDTVRAQEILDGTDYTANVRARQRFYHSQGINAVPAVIINDRHLISGGQPVTVFENALKQIASQAEA